MSNIIVTTGDLHKDYQVLGPVYFQVSNKGLFSSALGKLKEKYKLEIQSAKKSGAMSQDKADWGFLYGEWSVGQSDFEAAFSSQRKSLKSGQKWSALMPLFVCGKILTWIQTDSHISIFKCMVPL